MTQPSYRLLVIDDEPLALKLAQRVLETESDIEVHATTSPLQALEIARVHDIDLAIADQRMPELAGLDFLARFREIRPRALRLLLTAYPDISIALQSINEGLVYRFVLKPWDLDDMRITIRRTLETKRLSDEHDRLVAQLKSNYDELVRSERLAALGRLSAGIGHELDNAVTPLLVHLDLLDDEIAVLTAVVRSADQAIKKGLARDAVEALESAVHKAARSLRARGLEESLSAMKRAGEQLVSLTRGVKNFGRAAEATPMDINQAVLSAVQLVSHRFRATKLERDLSAVPPVSCCAPEITQVVLNLLGNAADAVEGVREPAVSVRTWHEGQRVFVEVADNGPGIDSSIATRLFQPFVTSKPAGRGTGLGLSICRSIIENHGGTIEAISPPGLGARFTVTLPASASVG